MRYKQEPGPPVAVGQAVILIVERGNYGFAGAGGGNNKVFEGLAVFALYLERFKDTRLVGMRRALSEATRSNSNNVLGVEFIKSNRSVEIKIRFGLCEYLPKVQVICDIHPPAIFMMQLI